MGQVADAKQREREKNKSRHRPYIIHLARQEMQEAELQSPGQEDPLEEGMATCSSVLVWRIPVTGEPVRLPSMGSHRVGHD